MLVDSVTLQDTFGCSGSVVCQIRKIIKDNPERYGPYRISGRLTHAGAFLDAKTNRKLLEAGLPAPEYDEAKAVETVKEMMK